jgi:hypothetical protein
VTGGVELSAGQCGIHDLWAESLDICTLFFIFAPHSTYNLIAMDFGLIAMKRWFDCNGMLN